MIKGVENLTDNQKYLTLRMNELHSNSGMEIVEVYPDGDDAVCVKFKNGSSSRCTINIDHD